MTRKRFFRSEHDPVRVAKSFPSKRLVVSRRRSIPTDKLDAGDVECPQPGPAKPATKVNELSTPQ